MRYKNPVHPKLYLSLIKDNDKILIKYKYNVFNEKGFRIIVEDCIKPKECCLYDDLIKINEEQLKILEKYIKMQKKVLQKHEKTGNYDACRIVEYSINEMLKFKKEFNEWFLKNNYES